MKLLISILLARALALSIHAAESDRPYLQGVVKDSKGEPIVAASVFVDSAWVKRGYSPLCPSCYADCAKKVVSAYNGRFTIASLDPQLRFTILVTAPGFKPQKAERVDPAKGGITVTLEPLNMAALDPDHFITGLILDDHGSPIADAAVVPGMFKTSSWDGFSPGVFDPLAVSDDAGRFVITANSKIQHCSFTVSARGYAPAFLKDWVPQQPAQTVRLDRGVTVTGRVLHGGKPLPHARVGLVQEKRNNGFFGETKIDCDDQGRFSFFNAHGGEDYFVYGIMDNLRHLGAIPARRIKLGASGTSVDVGDLSVEAGHVLKGQVVLADKGRIPARTAILLCRDEAWDQQQVELDADGRFEFKGLPAESYSVCVRVYGHILSRQNKSLDRANTDSLIGRVDEDITDLRVLMEPEVKPDTRTAQQQVDDFQADFEKTGWSQEKTRQEPLRGAPSGE